MGTEETEFPLGWVMISEAAKMLGFDYWILSPGQRNSNKTWQLDIELLVDNLAPLLRLLFYLLAGHNSPRHRHHCNLDDCHICGRALCKNHRCTRTGPLHRLNGWIRSKS